MPTKEGSRRDDLSKIIDLVFRQGKKVCLDRLEEYMDGLERPEIQGQAKEGVALWAGQPYRYGVDYGKDVLPLQ